MKNPANIVRDCFNSLQALPGRSKLLLGVPVLILIILGSIILLLLSPKFQNYLIDTFDSKGKLSKIYQANTALTLVAGKTTMKKGETQELKVLISGQTVTSTDVVLSYDSSVFKITKIMNGTVFDQELPKRTDANTLYFSATQTEASNERETYDTSKESLVFSFTIEALKQADTSPITFIKEKTITAKGIKNTLQNTQGVTLTVE